MTDCSKCASLCCIAPEIRSPDQWQGRIEGKVIKILNMPCEYICPGGCSIYESRGEFRRACFSYDCKGFGPYLTQYLRENNLFNPDNTLKDYGLRIFKILNAMMQLTFYGSQHPDLRDAIEFYQSHSRFPDWMLSEEYYDYLFKPGKPKINPRLKSVSSTRTATGTLSSFFSLAFSRFSL